MIFLRQAKFQKEFERLPKHLQEKALERLGVFEVDQFDPLLNNHRLRHEYKEYRSINVTGDYRIAYRMIDKETCLLFRIGTHDRLFGL